jgi:hypothetical protein
MQLLGAGLQLHGSLFVCTAAMGAIDDISTPPQDSQLPVQPHATLP